MSKTYVCYEEKVFLPARGWLSLKGQSNEIFDPQFFHNSNQ